MAMLIPNAPNAEGDCRLGLMPKSIGRQARASRRAGGAAIPCRHFCATVRCVTPL